MKRLFSAILVLAMLVCLCACDRQVETTTEPPVTTTVPATLPPVIQPKPKDPQMGDFADGVYSNDFLGISCRVGAKWTVYSDAQLAQLNGLVLDIMTDADIVEQLKKSNVAYLFYATAEGGHLSANVVLENVGVVNGVLLDEKTYMTLSAEQLPAALQSMGLTNATVEEITVHFAGADRPAVRVQGKFSGVNFYEKIVCIKVGDYFGVVTVASYHNDKTDMLLGLFMAK